MAKRKNKLDDDFDEPRSFFGFVVKWLLVLGIWAGIVLAGVLLWYGKDLIELTRKSNFERKRSVVILANDGQTVLATYGETAGTNIRVQDLPPHVSNAVMAIEDRRFRSHFGLDPIGLVRAAVTNFKAGRVVQGGSTITQQLAKNLFLKPERTLERKIQEAMLAIWLEVRYSKDEILSAYLNRVYFGAGAYGIDAAAQTYFDKGPENLTLEEAAMMAGLLKAPSRLSPENNPDRALARMNLVLSAMEDADLLEETKEIKPGQIMTPPRKPISLREKTTGARYFGDWILDRSFNLLGESGGDLTIVTTMDAQLQKETETAADQSVDEFFKDKEKKPQAAVVVLDRDGAIRAMVGGRDYRASQFNRAVQAQRQPGSAFKPFVYLAALEKGWRPGDLIEDAPLDLNGYKPTNHGGEYFGPVPLTQALAMSLNTAVVNLTAQIGVDAVLDAAKRAGIESELVHNYSIALGTSEVSVLEMASAYATIANYGVQTKAYGIISIRDGSNEILHQHESLPYPPVLDPDACKRLIAMMQMVVSNGTGGRAYPGFVVAGKTGTSQDYRDTWFNGFSGSNIATVWVGYDDNTSMKRQYGGNAPADIFRQVIKAAQKGRPIIGMTNADPYEQSLGGAFSSDGLGGVFKRLFGGRTAGSEEPQKPQRQRMRPIVDDHGFNR